ncbi:alkaline phosphatase [Riemerella anatipestifer]|nr:alkaline phosphatase [Riemerella anatipestifer]MDY3319130.1 alkaline phosphatase [Riemerella anatipestifer]MDY3325401.1 alkaline phosphatase [Riemerella anatipestifer]MDY3352609.1 alkaline phosphatase [Riemerella anatipestifer]
MKRRDFLKSGSIAALGGMLISPFGLKANTIKEEFRGKKAKNIIFMVSDGMSVGTLHMADIYSRRKLGRASHWLGLYENNLVQRAVMDMASASSIVTDSAAASSSWGGGVRVNNGSLNISPDGKENMPILQKFKKAGKKVGCVTTVPINHATPAGFCVTSKKRSAMEDIAVDYLDLGFDVMMGGGAKYFEADKRKDAVDLDAKFRSKGYTVVKNKAEMLSAPKNKPILGTFDEEALPYTVDHNSCDKMKANIPTLAEMTEKAISQMKDHPKGFVMQVEGGKVDWAAHGNDVAALLYDQLAFDEAVKVAMDFAKKDGNTLVVLTSDHGNANPGLIYGKTCNDNFDHIQNFKNSNEWILQGIQPDSSVSFVKERIAKACGDMVLSDDQAKQLLSYYSKAKQEDGLYNPRHLPFKLLSEMQKDYTSVGWISMDHSSDYTELAMFGPGSERLKPLMRNTDIHTFLLDAAEVENKF